jgi:competence protein ComEC
MKLSSYPLVRHFLFLASGIVVYAFTQWFHPLVYSSLAVFLLLLLAPNAFIRGISLAGLLFFAGITLTHHHSGYTNSQHYIHKLTSPFDFYKVTVTSNAEVKPKSYKVTAQVEQLRLAGKWQKAQGEVLLYFPLAIEKRPVYGDVFLIKGFPREVEPPKNPLEFDYKTYLARKNIYTHQFLRKNQYVFLDNQPPNLLQKWANSVRTYADVVFQTNLSDRNAYAIADAMVLGIREEIDHDLQKAYSAAGAIHVLSVSGMHVGIVYLLLQYLFGKRRLFKKQTQRFPKKEPIFALLVIVLLFAYALVTGFSASVVRATVMFSFIQLAPLFGRKHTIYNTLAFSAIVLLCYNPYWLFDVGFQLSYLAVFGIVWLYPPLYLLYHPTHFITRWLWSLTVVAFSAQLLTFPLAAYYFHQFPNYFLLANPLVALLGGAILPFGMVLLAVAKIPIVATAVAFCLELLLKTLNASMFFILELPNSLFQGISISVPEVILLYSTIIGVALFFFRTEIKWLKVAFISVFLFTIYIVQKDYQQSKQQEITFHYIPKKSSISIIDGKQAVWIADTSLTNDSRIYDFHLKNYYDQQGIVRYKQHIPQSTDGLVEILVNQKQIVWIRNKNFRTYKGKADYLMISNNSIKSLKTLTEHHKPQLIIIDDSNRRYLVEKLKAEANQLKLPIITLYDAGSCILR